MDVPMLKEVLMWCTVMNAGLLMFAFLFVAAGGGWAYRLHSRWFPMPRETFTVAMYAFIGAWKILVFVFIVIPWIALEIVG